MFKAFWSLTNPDFDGAAKIASEGENREALTAGDDSQKIVAMKQLVAVGCSIQETQLLLSDTSNATQIGQTSP